MKLEAIGQQKNRVEGNCNYILFIKLRRPGDREGTFQFCIWILWHSLHSSATHLMREGTYPSAHTYASEEGRKIDS